MLTSQLGEFSTLAADKAWPFFNQHRALIENKSPQDELFNCDDVLGLAMFDIKPRALWHMAKTSDTTGDTAMTIHTEMGNLLKLLDKIHACKPFSTPSTKTIVSADEKKKSLDVTQQSTKPSNEKNPSKDSGSIERKETKETKEEKENKHATNQKKATEQMRQMMERLIPLAGDDQQLKADFATMLKESDSNPTAEPTEKQQDIFERMLDGLLSNILPAADESDPSQDPRLRAVSSATQKVQTDQRRKKIREIFKHMATTPEALPQNDESVTTKTTAIAKKATQNSRYRIEAHFNFRLLEFFEHLVAFRGKETFKNKQGQSVLYFPQLEKKYQEIKQLFTNDNSTTAIIKPFGEWAVKHHAALKAHDISLFADAKQHDHEMMKTLHCVLLCKSFNDETQQDIWNRTHRIVTLATVYHDMNNQGFGDLMDIINEVLEDAKIGYNVDPKTFKGHSQLVDSIIDRCAEDSGMQRFKNIFGKMQSSGQNGLDGILKLVDHLTPNIQTKPKVSKKRERQEQAKSRFETEDM